MSGITLPPGAFQAAKAGSPLPSEPKAAPEGARPKVEAKAPPKPEAKRPEPKAEPEPPSDLTPAERKIWKLKVDGEEFDFDATDEDAVKREIQKARAANKRFEEAAKIRKEAEAKTSQAEQFYQMLKDPKMLRKVLSDPSIGVDVKKFAEEIVWEHIQDSQLTPEQREQREKEKRLKEYEDRETATKAEAEAKEKAASLARFEQSYESKILEALEIQGVPKKPEAVARMAQYLLKTVEDGYDLTPSELAAQVRSDYTDEIKSLFSDVEGDQLLALLGDAVAEKIRKADMKRLKTTHDRPFPKRSAQKQAAQSKEAPRPKRLTGSDWRAELAKDFLSRKNG